MTYEDTRRFYGTQDVVQDRRHRRTEVVTVPTALEVWDLVRGKETTWITTMTRG